MITFFTVVLPACIVYLVRNWRRLRRRLQVTLERGRRAKQGARDDWRQLDRNRDE